MSSPTEVLAEHIDSCQNLLNVFRKERREFLSRDSLTPGDVIPILKLKKRLLNSFETHRGLTGSLADAGPGEKSHDSLLRQLSSLLEQLLVIDRENEMMMRRILKKGRAAGPGRRTHLAGNVSAAGDTHRNVQVRKRKKICIRKTGPGSRRFGNSRGNSRDEQ